MGASDIIIDGRYRVVDRELGSGAQGKVLSAISLETGAHLAAKAFPGAESGRTEAALLCRCAGHPNVTAFLEFFEGVPVRDQPHSFLMMELVAGGDLFDRLISGGSVSEDAARPCFAQLVSAVAHCHAMGVAHRDIKLENVLIDVEGNVKLADFGLAGVFRVQEGGPERLLSDRCGSKAYVAPELIASRDQPYLGQPVDIWALGVCLFAMLANFFPFDVACPQRDWRVKHVLAAQAAGTSTCAVLFHLAGRQSPLSDTAAALLDRMLTFDPERRITMDELLGSPWLCAPESPLAGGALEVASDSFAAESIVDDDAGYTDISAMIKAGAGAAGPAENAAILAEDVYRSMGAGGARVALDAPRPDDAGRGVPTLRRERAFERWSTFLAEN